MRKKIKISYWKLSLTPYFQSLNWITIWLLHIRWSYKNFPVTCPQETRKKLPSLRPVTFLHLDDNWFVWLTKRDERPPPPCLWNRKLVKMASNSSHKEFTEQAQKANWGYCYFIAATVQPQSRLLFACTQQNSAVLVFYLTWFLHIFMNFFSDPFFFVVGDDANVTTKNSQFAFQIRGKQSLLLFRHIKGLDEHRKTWIWKKKKIIQIWTRGTSSRKVCRYVDWNSNS